MNKMHKQQWYSDRVLKKAKTSTFYFKNIRQYKKQATSNMNSVRLVWKLVACEYNSHGLKIAEQLLAFTGTEV